MSSACRSLKKGKCRMIKFKFICAKCGSSQITITEYENYNGNDEYCGSDYLLKCENCNEEQYLRDIVNEY